MKNQQIKALKNRRRGQGATEYIIILVLVAISSIAVITVFGDTLRDLFHGATQELQGNDYQPQNADASGEVNQTLGDF